MICPACNSPNPDDVRFCLQCGQYQGEFNDEQTVFKTQSAGRSRPATTINAQFIPTRAHYASYEAPRDRRWPFWIAFGVLSLIALVGVGLLAAVLIQQSGGVVVNLPDNQRLTVLAKETPTPTPTPAVVRIEPTPVRTAPALITSAPTPEVPVQIRPRYVVDSLAVEWSNWLPDGEQRMWQLPPGVYAVEFVASGSGGTIELTGSFNCPKTKAMLRFRQRCEASSWGYVVVTNPTIFAAGPAISVTLKVVRLREE